MQTLDVAERARLLRQRLALLEKGFSASSLTNPTRGPEMLDLARAREDAGELESAATLARAVLRLVPQMEKDPQIGAIAMWCFSTSRSAAASGNLAEASRIG